MGVEGELEGGLPHGLDYRPVMHARASLHRFNFSLRKFGLWKLCQLAKMPSRSLRKSRFFNSPGNKKRCAPPREQPVRGCRGACVGLARQFYVLVVPSQPQVAREVP
jgi:hypothetical protein